MSAVYSASSRVNPFFSPCEKVSESVPQKQMFFFNTFLEDTEATWPNSTVCVDNYGKEMVFTRINYSHCKAEKD